MMMTRIYFTILLVIGFSFAKAQSNGQWISVGLEGKLNKKILFEAEQGFRFSDMFSIIQSTYSDIGINYKFTKEFRIAANYRFTQRGGMFNTLHFENRFSGEMRLKKKFNDLTIGSRIRYLSRYRDYNSSEYGTVPQQFIRFKIDLDYNLPKKFTATIGSEIFWQLTAFYGRGFNNFWIIAGVNYDLSDTDRIGLTFIRQSREFASDDIAFGNVISLSFVHQLNLSYSDK
jgi:hypothetical protein